MVSVKILGLNSAGYYTSAALLIDGTVAFAVEEGRLVREKRTRRFPMQGIRRALAFARLRLEDLDAVAVAWNPAVNLEAFSRPYSQRARHFGEIFYNVPNHLMTLKENNAALLSTQEIEFLDGAKLKIFYVTHHLAHASSFFFSPFNDAAVMSIDAFGEKDCVLFAEGRQNRLNVLWSQEFPHSLGSFYSAMTEFLGFQPQGDEWKLMGASAYGDPRRFTDALKGIARLKDRGFELDLSFFNHYQFHRPGLFTPKLAELLGVGPNRPDAPLTRDHFDVAAAAQRVFEEIYLGLLRQLAARVKTERLVLSGGAALNSVANGKIREQSPFREVFIPPAPDDSGGSLGSAFYVYHQVMGKPRAAAMRTNYFGPGYTDEEIRGCLEEFKVPHTVVGDPAASAARLIASGKIIGWFQGRLEFGDRALGNRSILADPRDPSNKDRVNATVKFREPFRPFAPSILAEHLDEYFTGADPVPFMEKVFPVRPEKRGVIPAVTHVDGSGRAQSVTRESNPLFRRLIEEFHALTGVPVVLNTSFNLKGEPIVCSPQDALRTFFSSGLDALVMGNCLVLKGGSRPDAETEFLENARAAVPRSGS